MTDLTTTPSTSDALPLQAPSLPRYGTIAAIVFAIAVGALVSMVIGAGYVAALVIAWLVLVVALHPLSHSEDLADRASTSI